MNIPKKQQRKILDSATEPSDRNFLWLDVSSSIPVLKRFTNGKWVSIIDTTIRPYDGNDEKPTPTPDDLSEYAKVSWVNSKVNPISTRLSNVILSLKEYVKKSELPEFPDIQSIISSISEIKNAVRRCVTLEYLNYTYKFYLDNTYQKKLTAGDGINIDGNNVIKSTVSADIESIQHDISSINTALLNKQDILEPGPNISISGNTISASISGGGTSVQPDWDQTDENSADYIKNKPDLDTLFNAKQDKLESGVNIVTINGNSLLGGGNLNIKGGSGSGSSVEVVQEGADTSDNNTLYFFSPSPLQAEGLYNNLLQNGSENGIVYNPGTLYRIGDSGEFCTESQDNITIENNRVYCCGQMTTMKHYGDVVLSNSLKYAETSDTARISFTVVGPFHANKTRVAVNYDESKVHLEYRRVSLSTWKPVPNSGYMFDFYSTSLQDAAVLLRVVRFSSGTNEQPYGNRTETDITFNNGHESVSMHIVFPSCKLFFKEGNTYSNFDLSTVPELRDDITPEGPEQEFLISKKLWWIRNQIDDPTTNKMLHPAYAYYSGNLLIFVGGDNYRKRAMRLGTVDIDRSRLNILYIVVVSNWPNGWLWGASFDMNWDGKDNSNNDYIWYNSSRQLGTGGDNNGASVKNNISLWGSHVIRCFIQDIHFPYSLNNLPLYLVSAYNGNFNIKEIGLLTY